MKFVKTKRARSAVPVITQVWVFCLLKHQASLVEMNPAVLNPIDIFVPEFNGMRFLFLRNTSFAHLLMGSIYSLSGGDTFKKLELCLISFRIL